MAIEDEIRCEGCGIRVALADIKEIQREIREAYRQLAEPQTGKGVATLRAEGLTLAELRAKAKEGR